MNRYKLHEPIQRPQLHPPLAPGQIWQQKSGLVIAVYHLRYKRDDRGWIATRKGYNRDWYLTEENLLANYKCVYE